MSANGISHLPTKEARQKAKLDSAAAKRAAFNKGSNTRHEYDIAELPTQYYNNTVENNPNPTGLIQGRPWITGSASSKYAFGLYRTTYSGYFADNPAFFSNASTTGATADSTLSVNPLSTTTSLQYLGYFVPRTTEAYTFYTISDDASYLWIGANATVGFTTNNATVNNGGEHGDITAFGTVNLTAGTYYPIRIQAGNDGGPGDYATKFSTPTIANTAVFTDVIFYNTNTNGF
jgi:hypothetical protein